jgi:hypothetical protein
MALLTSLIVVIGVLSLSNLVLLYGVIRRLRLHAEALAARPPSESVLGAVVQPFRVTSVDGTEVTGLDLEPGTIAGFFAPGCGPCEELLPRFTAAVAGHPVLAVVAEGDDGPYVDRLRPAGTVVTGAAASVVAAAFGVRSYPVLCRVGPGGTLQEIDRDLRDLLVAA